MNLHCRTSTVGHCLDDGAPSARNIAPRKKAISTRDPLRLRIDLYGINLTAKLNGAT